MTTGDAHAKRKPTRKASPTHEEVCHNRPIRLPSPRSDHMDITLTDEQAAVILRLRNCICEDDRCLAITAIAEAIDRARNVHPSGSEYHGPVDVGPTTKCSCGEPGDPGAYHFYNRPCVDLGSGL